MTPFRGNFFYRNRVELTHSMEYVTLCGKMTEFSRSNMSWKNVYPPAWVIDKLLSALSDSWVEGEVGLQVLTWISVHRDLWCCSFWGSNAAIKQIPSTGSWLPQFPMMTALLVYSSLFSLLCMSQQLSYSKSWMLSTHTMGVRILECFATPDILHASMCVYDFYLYILLEIPVSYVYLLLRVDSFSPSKCRRFLRNTLSNSIFS